jgi:hypothetical protein
MRTVGSDAQPATGHRSVTVSDTLDEKALPRSESGIEQIEPSDDNNIIKLDEFLCLNDTNWVVWRVHIINIFRRCGVEGYVKGTLLCPDPNVDPEGAENWDSNDAYTQLIISLNVTQSQEVNILTCNTAHEVWKNLEVANRSQGSRTMLAYGRKLCHTTAGERDNIIEHLDKLKKYRQQINFAASGDKQLEISDSSFNTTIAQSLPPSWGSFTGNYVVQTSRYLDDHPGMVSYQRFIDLIEREYWRREQWDREYLATHITTYVG